MVKYVVTAAYGISPPGYLESPLNQFLRSRHQFYLDAGYEGRTDLDDPKPTFLTCLEVAILAVKYGQVEEIVLVAANNGHLSRMITDMNHALDHLHYKGPRNIRMDIGALNYPGPFYYEGTQDWCTSPEKWKKYHWKVVLLASWCFRPIYRLLCYRSAQRDSNQR